MKMRKILFGVMVALLLIASLTPIALAQDSNRLAQLKISVWPEYDTPTVLVLLDGVLADKTNLPREVSVLVPSTAKLTVTTWQNADGSLAPEQSNKTVDAGGGYTRVTFTTSQPQYRIEYYDDLLKGAPDKTMDFAYKAAVPADQVTLEIQQPLKATNFVLTPPTSNTRNDVTDGFKYFTYQFANVTAGQLISAQAKYTKADSNPSVQPVPTALPSTTASSTAAPSSNDSLMLLVGLVALGLVAVLGLFLYQQRSRQAERVGETKMSPRQFQRNRRRARGMDDSASVFCTQCGNTLGPDDNFCPKCGAKRRAV
jgi:hypothetical protein